MDDLVVIILTLLVAVIGIIAQTKKRKVVDQQPNTGNSPQNIWNILESQMAPEPQKYEPEPEYEPEDEIVDVVPKTTFYEFDAKNEGKSAIKENADSKVLVNEFIKIKKEKFPLRKAIIYSEILRRKYI